MLDSLFLSAYQQQLQHTGGRRKQHVICTCEHGSLLHDGVEAMTMLFSRGIEL